jgi:acyl-CoA synthetase (AMP-forming)/AMP-acid ligase II
MMSQPLLVSSLIRHADRWHGDTEIVSRRCEGGIHRYTYSEAHRRARQLANVLAELKVTPGTRVGTLAWNGFRHVEIYYAVSGSGAVCHTINPRLFPDQIAWIVNDAEDAFIFFDLTFVKLVEAIAPKCPHVKGWVAMTDREHMPDSPVPLLCYEELMAAAGDRYEWPQFDENTASSLCYTSGTTGNPKGALYSHRSTLLHCFGSALPDTLGLSASDVILPVVPMFHVNAWGSPYAAAMVGAKLVLPGPNLDGASLYELFESERVTFTAGVPTVWLTLLTHLEEKKLRLSTVKRVVIGGSAVPPAMIRAFRQQHGAEVLHAWGMTETSPLATLNRMKTKHADWDDERRDTLREKQGRPVFGVDLEIVGGDGKPLPHDGVAFGDLLIKGPWVVDSYFRGAGGSILHDGWFPTGDVATIDADGYVKITDRSKDVIKSGGEWISSIDIENAMIAHPSVAESAVIGIAHPKWDERPILVIVKRPGTELTRDEALAFLKGRIAKWWLPNDVVFVESLPHTATGKLSKLELRKQFANYRLPDA